MSARIGEAAPTGATGAQMRPRACAVALSDAALWLCALAVGAAFLGAGLLGSRPTTESSTGQTAIGSAVLVLGLYLALSRLQAAAARRRLHASGVRAVARIAMVDRLGVWRRGRPSPFQVSALEVRYEFECPVGTFEGVDEIPQAELESLEAIPGPGDLIEVVYSPEDPLRSTIAALPGNPTSS